MEQIILVIIAVIILFLLITKSCGCSEKFVAPKYDHIYRERACDIIPQRERRRGYLKWENCPSGADYPSAAPIRDIYYQPEQGRLGDSILSGFPFYNAY